MRLEVPDFGEACGRQTMPDRIKVIRGMIARHGARVDMLEVGSWVGHGAVNWRAEIAKLPEKGSLTCVDPWRPYHREFDLEKNPVCQIMHKALEEDEAYRLFLRNTSFGSHEVPLYHHRATLAEVADRLPQFDIVLIDGSHYYEDVKEDLRLARTLVKPGGMILGDDLEKQMDECEDGFIEQYKHVDCWLNVHPGVTAAVWETFGRVASEKGVWWTHG